jgi:hypothetical protein
MEICLYFTKKEDLFFTTRLQVKRTTLFAHDESEVAQVCFNQNASRRLFDLILVVGRGSRSHSRVQVRFAFHTDGAPPHTGFRPLSKNKNFFVKEVVKRVEKA